MRIKFSLGGQFENFCATRILATNFVLRGEKIAEVKETLIPLRNLSLARSRDKDL